ncbi:uncharacterized protein At3g28850-like [Telopea speciosissima]|uniref:uncharacterized protein At3g28850-like n=1 Tax=Telopea speciosissima TaxID=54955 RepID=UPI001CC676A6|nr:uncharacterized protein At3g28850-like [Telopea speciosissima]
MNVIPKYSEERSIRSSGLRETSVKPLNGSRKSTSRDLPMSKKITEIRQEALQLLRSHRLDNSESNSIGEGKVKKLYNSFESSADPRENNNSSMKSLWKHMSEELLLADMDPNVVSSFRHAMSSRQLGMNQSKILRPLVGSSSRVSPLSDYRSRLPGTEDKIVVYFTSLRGIQRTYEDCCVVRNNLVDSVDERDVSMDSAYRGELQNVLGW